MLVLYKASEDRPLAQCPKCKETVEGTDSKLTYGYGAVVTQGTTINIVDINSGEVALTLDEESAKKLFTSLLDKFYLPELQSKNVEIEGLRTRVKELERDVIILARGEV